MPPFSPPEKRTNHRDTEGTEEFKESLEHPEKGRVYVLRIMTHEEYDERRWKDEL
jgi:hypothetical protein